jgi:hypothetical protein
MDSSETEGLSSADGSTRYRSSTTRKTGSGAERLDKSDELLRKQPPATVARPRSEAERPVARQSAITPHGRRCSSSSVAPSKIQTPCSSTSASLAATTPVFPLPASATTTSARPVPPATCRADRSWSTSAERPARPPCGSVPTVPAIATPPRPRPVEGRYADDPSAIGPGIVAFVTTDSQSASSARRSPRRMLIRGSALRPRRLPAPPALTAPCTELPISLGPLLGASPEATPPTVH